jgi:hypothetical protein
MVGTLEFEADGRTYACRLEAAGGKKSPGWWWFTVSGDGHRYAPFRAAEGDTAASIRARIIEYYTNHVTRRSEPNAGRPAWGRRPQPASIKPA